MVSKADKNVARLRRHKRVRGKISGTPERPRLDVFRSNMHIYAQIIDDVNGVTLCAASSVEKAFTGNGGNKEAAHAVGKLIAERAAERVSPMWSSTAAAISSTAASKSWPTAPARAASTSKKEEYCFGYEN